MNMNREDYCVVNFFVDGTEEDSEYSTSVFNVQHIPKINEVVNIYGTRDDNGNYVRKEPEFIVSGIVLRVEHTFEQRGASSSDCHYVQFVSVYLESIKLKGNPKYEQA